MTNEPATVPDDSLEPIKQVTSEEAQFASKLAQLRAAHKGQLEVYQRETETLLLQTRAEAERARETTLTTARAEGDREAETIVGIGSAKAGSIRGKTPEELARQQEAILSAVLAEFRASGKNPSA
jgi:vacuolar-type H+-ATPase subunit H